MEKDRMPYRVAVIIGHTPKGDMGAYSITLGMSEYEYNSKVAEALKNLSDGFIRYDVYNHTIQGYKSRITTIARRLTPKNYDLIIELHFNSASVLAHGTECLYWFASQKGKLASQIISEEVSKEFDTVLRGIGGSRALVNQNDRGYWFTYLFKAVSIIVEPFFGSNPSEAEKFKNIDKYAGVLDKGIKRVMENGTLII